MTGARPTATHHRGSPLAWTPVDGDLAALPPLHRPPNRPQASKARLVFELPLLILVAAVLALGVKQFVAQAYYIPSESMLPQLEVGDRVVVSRLSYRLHDPRRGDLVVFDEPGQELDDDDGPLPVRVARDLLEGLGVVRPEGDVLIKRVVATEGETVEGRAGHVFVGGRELFEPYLPDGTYTSDFAPVIVPDGHVFVLGDNRTDSSDSRVFGPVDEDEVIGRAIVVVWPPGRWELL